ncbi:type VI secretion system-associated lipoprotein [Pseudomonas syringae]|uniref:Type VI secretion system protein VasD n=1 Tax=Pseudomonas syringae TaxID=317 RepID=A0AB37ZNZ6_PSESX|nr:MULTISPECIES: type VI secretion system lipoprotein TssJ [Pseudomonas]MBI6667468.1 type VI secretion system lipoprotein TssJ [Pseudomonas syringae]MBI6676604.1 type VI secretion system lipoprotein TssJ [Pseudomonas syringae]MBI6839804.1 type VI secretion system lipoprotein TssJ [Pseudomonas syringae]MCK9689824.1 type VI secretion system lipoprotein TssJ [Pseudomonas syringae pv. syringae]MCK9709972.1 type VI secretion system lipoprotein TssJ [Pseudomonas syringae pv. syringae]
MNKRLQGNCSSKPALARCLAVLAMMMALSACGVTDRVAKRMDDTWAGDMMFGDNEKVILTTDGGNQLNPDEYGKPLSVVVRVYQLSSLERFESINADTLWDDPQKALGNTMVESRELILLPGMGQTDQWPLNPNASYVGIAAFFRTDVDSRWKVAFDANTLRKDGIWFSSDGVRVLVDNNYILAVRGVDVLNKLKTEEQFNKSNSIPEQPASKSMTERAQDAAVQQVQDSAGSAAKKAADSQFNSLLEGAK